MLDHAAISGQATAGSYSQTLISGDYYFVLSLTGPEDQVNLKLGHDTIAKIEELLGQTSNIHPKELVESLSAQFENGVKLNLLAAKIAANKLTLAPYGQVYAKLFRQGKIIDLSNKFITGPIHPGDLLVLSTAALPPTLDPNPPVTEIRDSLLLDIESKTVPNFTAILVRAGETEEIEESTEDVIEPPAPESVINPSSPKNPINIFLRRPSSRSPDNDQGKVGPRRVLYFSLIAFVILISLIAFQLRSRALESRVNNINQLKQQVADGLSSAQKLQGLNDALARDNLLQTKTDFETKAAADFGPDWKKEPALKSLDDSLISQIANVSHIYPVSSLDTYYDFSLLKANSNIVSAELHQGEIVALDQTNGSLYSLNLANKGAAIITGGSDFKTSQTIDFSGDNIFSLTSVGIYQTNRSVSPATNKLIIKPDTKWGNIKSLKTFGGNLYLLDPQNTMIWKYLATDLGFADLAPYLKTGLSLDFSKVQTFAIDGYIYIISKTGSLVRFAQGNPDDFNITGLDSPLSNSTAIYVSDETQNIYVLDNNGTRLVVMDKKGVYQAQYQLPSPANSQIILVSESAKKVFLISKSLVSFFDLH